MRLTYASPPAAPFAGGLRRIAAFLRSRREADLQRREAEMLAELSDHILYDIGLTRQGVAPLPRHLMRANGRR